MSWVTVELIVVGGLLVSGLLAWLRRHPTTRVGPVSMRFADSPLFLVVIVASMSALVGLVVANLPPRISTENPTLNGVVLGLVCLGLTLTMVFRERSRSRGPRSRRRENQRPD
jgi:putative copper export protein